MKKCPRCKIVVVDPDRDEYLYQRSYLGQPEYISERCLSCYKKKVKQEEKRLYKGGETNAMPRMLEGKD